MRAMRRRVLFRPCSTTRSSSIGRSCPEAAIVPAPGESGQRGRAAKHPAPFTPILTFPHQGGRDQAGRPRGTPLHQAPHHTPPTLTPTPPAIGRGRRDQAGRPRGTPLHQAPHHTPPTLTPTLSRPRERGRHPIPPRLGCEVPASAGTTGTPVLIPTPR